MNTSCEEFYLKIISGDFSIYDELQQRIPADLSVLLAEHLVALSVQYEKIVPLVAWLMKNEVANTKHYSSLFREDSLGKAIVNRVLFGTTGIKYLKCLLLPMVTKLVEHGTKLEIAAHKVGEKEAKENVNALINAVDTFVTTFKESELSCPLMIRKLMMQLQIRVDEKFGKEEQTVPFGLHFFFFSYICVAMVNCDRYGIISTAEMTDSLRTGLINASKILKDLAGQTVKEGDHEAILQYHKEKGSVLAETFTSLIDIKAIEMAKKILMANTSFRIKPEEMHREKVAFMKFLEQHLMASRSTSISSDASIVDNESPEMYAKMKERYLQKLNDPAWKLKKKKSGIDLFILKEKNVSAVSLKAEWVVPVPLQETFDFWIPRFSDPKYDNIILDVKTICSRGNYEEKLIDLKMPFPMSNRDCATVAWTIREPDRIFMITEDNKRYPPQEGRVRTENHLGGYEFSSFIAGDGSMSTRIKSIIHGDPKGSIPKWLVNSLVMGQGDKLVLIKKDFETHYNCANASSSSSSSKHDKKSDKAVRANTSTSSVTTTTDRESMGSSSSSFDSIK